MEAGAAPLITIAPNVSLNFKTKADFNMDQPPASVGLSGIGSLTRPVEDLEKKDKNLDNKLKVQVSALLLGVHESTDDVSKSG